MNEIQETEEKVKEKIWRYNGWEFPRLRNENKPQTQGACRTPSRITTWIQRKMQQDTSSSNYWKLKIKIMF